MTQWSMHWGSWADLVEEESVRDPVVVLITGSASTKPVEPNRSQ